MVSPEDMFWLTWTCPVLMTWQKFPYRLIKLLMQQVFVLATELLADADISEGATKKKQTRGNKKMDTIMIKYFIVAYCYFMTDVSLLYLLTVTLWHFTRLLTLNCRSQWQQWILFPLNLNVSWDELDRNLEIQGKQNSLFPKGPAVSSDLLHVYLTKYYSETKQTQILKNALTFQWQHRVTFNCMLWSLAMQWRFCG